MTSFARIAIAGVAAGVAASLVMNRYQAATAKAFGQDGGAGEPATVKAARDAAAVAGGTLAESDKEQAGNLVHYATGIALGLGYVAAVDRWPRAKAGFGIGYGLTAALLLDDVAVPALGWGEWPWKSGAGANLYGVSAHAVFGAALEGTRRAVLAAIDQGRRLGQVGA